MGGFKITGLGTPTAGTDAATKDYVDNLSAGLSWKDAVRVATTANGTIGTAFANGQTVDGVYLATGNRILIKNQSTGTENGIYVVTAGAPTRATDADAVGELDGAFVVSMEGTANADKAWICSTNPPITPGTTATTWAYFGAGTAYSAGAGLTLTGSTFDVVADSTIVVTADQIARAAITGDVTASAGSNGSTITALSVTNGKLAAMPTLTIKGNNTGISATPVDLTVAQMKTLLGYPSKYVQATIGGATSQVVTHNLNTRDCIVSVYRTLTPWDEVDCDIEYTTVNTITLRFNTAPAANEYSITVIG